MQSDYDYTLLNVYSNKKLRYRWQTARRICAMQRRGRPNKNAPLRMCYRAEFGHKYRRTPKNGERGN